MSKPTHIWFLLAACAALIFGTMAWMTRHVLRGDESRREMLAQADLQDRTRLSLSRMDSAIGALLIVENQRPPSHYRAFFNAPTLYNQNYQPAPTSNLLQPSPLLSEPLEFIHLHFQIESNKEDSFTPRQLTSPQVPQLNNRALAHALFQNHLDATAKFQQHKTLFAQLSQILGQPLNPPQASPLKGSLLCQDTHLPPAPSIPKKDESSTLSVQPESQKIAWDTTKNATNAQNRQDSLYQDALSKKEKVARKAVSQEVIEKATKRSQATGASYAPNTKTAPPAPSANFSDSASDTREEQPLSLIPSTLQAHWIDRHLFLIRQLQAESNTRPSLYQGLWLNAPALESYLLSLTADLLPQASLSPNYEKSSNSDNPNELVGLPWKLIPNESSAQTVRNTSLNSLGWTGTHSTLALGWLAALIAFGAIALLLRGVLRLSERRASFVSSVTHELRTPLTTFRLYSEMLAEGMVQPESKRQDYLRVMQSESERLNHLVENVLAYSQIERGTARSQTETTTLAALLDRLLPTFNRRVAQDNATLTTAIGSPDAVLTTDLTAVEQILFNLLDNACKYGLPADLPPTKRILHLHLESTTTHYHFHLSDPGPGIQKNEARKLFRPFHKSAQEAAHSKPGVGLGLALSRRLARALKGTLTHNHSKKQNTFTLAIRKTE